MVKTEECGVERRRGTEWCSDGSGKGGHERHKAGKGDPETEARTARKQEEEARQNMEKKRATTRGQS